MLRDCIIIGVFAALLATTAWGQQIKPNGGFVEKEVLVGQPATYTLSVTYLKSLQVVFPDSAYDYYPFEFVGKAYFTTQTDSTTSYDSVVYTLSSFIMEPRLSLALPVFLVNGKDSTTIDAQADTLTVVNTLTEMPDSLKVLTNTEAVATARPFNYLLTGLVTFVIVVVLVVVLALNYDRIVRRLQARRLKKRHLRFLQKFNGYIDDVRQQNRTVVEEALLLWKAYMERLEKVQYTKLTTKELKALIEQQEVYNALGAIDRTLYGGQDMAELHQQFSKLHEFSVQRYVSIVKKLKHGK